MLPASNRGVGETFGFPDVCLTPAGPAVVPVPYPNIGMNAMAVPFSPNVLLTMMPALNMGSEIPLTMGDQAGVAHPTIMGAARYTMGNPIVKVNMLPAINLLCPTTGNNMNDGLGAVLVPSVTNVFFTSAAPAAPHVGRLDRASLDRLAAAMAAADDDVTLRGAVAIVRPGPFAFATPARVGEALARAGDVAGVVFDLRGHPGGDLDAAL
ncbi:MAG TPA: DUF4150 domain-containing protein, partial [Minicystis sp.]|nr:DUF4150 domain-containing protein [Minicystis sp.]